MGGFVDIRDVYTRKQRVIAILWVLVIFLVPILVGLFIDTGPDPTKCYAHCVPSRSERLLEAAAAELRVTP